MKLSQVGSESELNKWFLRVLKSGDRDQRQYSTKLWFDLHDKWTQAFEFDGHVNGIVGVGKISFADSVLADEVFHVLTKTNIDRKMIMQTI
tara:strand:+ start:111 stop:383 length:273 start_codon:yes stop_codon:yes gene_type:complete